LTQVSRKSKPAFASPAVSLRRSRGALLVRSPRPLASYARCTGEFLEQWASVLPGRSFLVERSARGGWRHLTFGETRHRVRRIAGWLLERRFSAARPVAILSENSIEHALLMLSCLHVGIPVAPIGRSGEGPEDVAELKKTLAALNPGLIYLGEDRRALLPELRARSAGTLVVGGGDAPEDVISFDSLRTEREAAVNRAFGAVKPDTVAKILFARESEGEPRGVITTHRMLCSSQGAMAQVWPFVTDLPVLLDWLPWSDPYAGNLSFNLALFNGGVLHIDRGRPRAGQFDETLTNLRDVAPTMYVSVPEAYELLVDAMVRDKLFRQRFFKRLRLILCAGVLSPETFQALHALARETVDRDLPVLSSWGLAETSPLAVAGHFLADNASVIGLPLPGTDIKLVPHGDKLEARVRGPNVTPGYWQRLDASANAFDPEGFLKTGTALRFADAARPERGLVLDGRISALELAG